MASILSELLNRDYPDTENPDEVRAMPMILHVERQTPPARTALLEAAAAAAVALCLDPQAEPGGDWHADVYAWITGRIRKVTRRARGAHWAAVQTLPGVIVEVDGAQVRALVPGRVREVPKEVSRLQISGSELPLDSPGEIPASVPTLWLNPAISMTAGKAAAQVGHGSMLLGAILSKEDIAAWAELGYRCAVRTSTSTHWARLMADSSTVVVRDAGFTEVEPGTVTVAAQWLNR